jgi:DNA-binding GntR family transcriptional regulator
MVTKPDQTADKERPGVARALDEIRLMVLSGELLPGERLTQAGLADRLGMSRIPVREALATLYADGLLEHKPNVGFTVARFSSEDLSEIYLMRRLLETQLLATTDFDRLDLDLLIAQDEAMNEVSSSEQPEIYSQLNMEFHFTLFAASPLELIRQELTRLWHMSAFYRSLYLFEVDTYSQLQHDHEKIIDAARSRDVKRLIEISDEHRTRTERLVVRRLRRRTT